MDDSELFDVFNIDNNPEPVQKTVRGVQRVQSKKSRKSGKGEGVSNETPANSVNGKRSHDQSRNDEKNNLKSTQISKKPRKNNDAPIVVDSFETESDQIVPATQGLQGTAPADQNIVIKKRVLLHLVQSNS